MADLRRIITLFINVETGERVISAADLSPDPTTWVLLRTSQVLFRAHLLLNDGTYFNPAAGTTWHFGIDKDFTADQADLVTSLDAQFNISGDWSLLSPTAGKICWRADLTPSTLKSAFTSSSNPDLTMYAGLIMTPPAGAPVPIIQWSMTIRNVAIDISTATAVSGVTHVTTEAAAASFVPQWGDAARWRWRAGGWQYFFEEDSKWRHIMFGLGDGSTPVFKAGDPED